MKERLWCDTEWRRKEVRMWRDWIGWMRGGRDAD